MIEGSWYDLGSEADFLADRLRGAMVGGARLCVGRAGETLFAVDDTCPHAGGSLSEGIIDADQVICPLHAYAFDVKTGHCPDDPACSVRAFPVRVADGIVQVQV